MRVFFLFLYLLISLDLLVAKGKLAISDNGVIYASMYTERGDELFYFKNKKWKKIALPKNMNFQINSLCIAYDNLYIVSLMGLYKYDLFHKKWSCYFKKPSYCCSIIGNDIWVGSNKVIYKNKRSYCIFNDIDDLEINVISSSRSMRKFGTSIGVYETNSPKSYINRSHIKLFKNQNISDMIVTTNNIYFIADFLVWRTNLNGEEIYNTQYRSHMLEKFHDYPVIGRSDNLILRDKSIRLQGVIKGMSVHNNKLWVLTTEFLYSYSHDILKKYYLL